MNQRLLGIIIIIIGIMFAVFTIALHNQTEQEVASYIQEQGTCYTPEGTCLHQKQTHFYLFGGILSAALIILGVYLLFFDKSYEQFKKEQLTFAKELQQAKQKDEFTAYLAGFTPEEQTILKAIREQEGIKQSTLRYRAGMSKTMLSILLNSLEKRDVVTKKKAGKTNELYLRKKF